MKKLFILITAVVFTSCAKKEEDSYKARKTSVLELRQLVNKTETTKNTYGSFFLVMGSVQSNESTESYVKVFAKVDGYFRVITIPIDKLRVNIDNTLEKPNLVITYSDRELTDSCVVEESYNNKFIISCPEKYLPENLLPIEL
jgi:hypothetical protein